MSITKAFLPTFLVIVFGLTLAGPAQCDQTIAGTPIKDNLRVTVKDDGSILVEQHNGSQFRGVVATNVILEPRKGSHFVTGGIPCGLGGFSITDQQLVANSTSGDTIVTKLRCPTASVLWTQDVTYRDGTDYLSYTWTITNEASAFTTTDLRFFHGEDTLFGNNAASGVTGAEQANGFYSTKTSAVGAFQKNGANAQIFSLRSNIAVNGYTVAAPGSVNAQVVNGVLDNALTTQNDVGYALEWRTPSLGPGESWVIRSWEQFSDRTFTNSVAISSPIVSLAVAGVTTDAIFTVRNESASSITFSAATATIAESGWTAQVVSPSVPLTVSPGNSVDITVQVTAPLGAAIGTLGSLTMSLTSTLAGAFSETAIIEVSTPPAPTPTVTARATSTPTRTPTPTTTPTPTAAAPSLIAPLRASAANRPLFKGRASAGALVRVIIDGAVVLKTTASDAGTWGARVDSDLADGLHSFTVEATDKIGRTVSLGAAREFVITGGAALDFDGDGLTDLTRYSDIGGSVSFKTQYSSDDTTAHASITGAVPAPGDYDGDLQWDFASISLSGSNLVWRVKPSGSTITESEEFGTVGDQPLTGCSLLTAGKSSIAVVRSERKILAKELGKATGVDSESLTSGSIIGCVDVNGDNIDDVIVLEPIPNSDRVTLAAVTLSGTQLGSVVLEDFERAFSITPRTGEIGQLAFVRLAGPHRRTAEILSLLAPEAVRASIDIPRKVVVSSGLLLNPDKSFTPHLIYQDLRKGTISTVDSRASSTTDLMGRIAKGTLLLQPHYLYKTKRR